MLKKKNKTKHKHFHIQPAKKNKKPHHHTRLDTCKTHHSFSYRTNHPSLTAHPFYHLPATTGRRPGTDAPRERRSRGPPKMPCLQKPRPEPDLRPNIGDDRRLAERPGPGKKKPSRGKKKKSPSWGFFYSNLNKKIIYCRNIKYNLK